MCQEVRGTHFLYKHNSMAMPVSNEVLKFPACATTETCASAEATKATAEASAAAARAATEAADVESSIVSAFPRVILISAFLLFRCFLGCLAQHGRDGFSAMVVEPESKETNGQGEEDSCNDEQLPCAALPLHALFIGLARARAHIPI